MQWFHFMKIFFDFEETERLLDITNKYIFR